MDFQQSNSQISNLDQDTKSSQSDSKAIQKNTKKLPLLTIILIISLLMNAGLGYLYLNSTSEENQKFDTESNSSLSEQRPQLKEKKDQTETLTESVPEGFRAVNKSGISFYWPESWGDAPEVKSGPTESYVVEQKFSSDLKYSQDNGYWVYAEDGFEGQEKDSFAQIGEEQILLKDFDKTIYTFGFGDAGCGHDTPTLILNGTVVQFDLPTICSGQGSDEGLADGQVKIVKTGEVVAEEKYNQQKRAVVKSIALK